MIGMRFTIELDIGFSLLLKAALPQLGSDHEPRLVVVGGPSDRRAVADATLRASLTHPATMTSRPATQGTFPRYAGDGAMSGDPAVAGPRH
jgi:hypothetical protein